MSTQILEQHIVSTPDVRFGKPRIDGTRIAVIDVGIWYAHMGYGVEKIAQDYHLTLGQVHAALAYYYDHKDEFDRQIAEDEAFFEREYAKTPSLLKSAPNDDDQVLS